MEFFDLRPRLVLNTLMIVDQKGKVWFEWTPKEKITPVHILVNNCLMRGIFGNGIIAERRKK